MKTKFEYTVFTPSYNRVKLLPRAYESLLRQSYKDFVWLIVDDGSTDDTKELVKKWQKENLLQIEYIYKQNGGKYTAMITGFHKITSDFCVTLDSDDELTPDALEVFDQQWKLIYRNGLMDKIIEIRANSRNADTNKIAGNYQLTEGSNLDISWHDFYLKLGANNECISCHKTWILKRIFIPNEEFWLSGKFRSIQESVFWARYGRYGIMRHIYNSLRVYNKDAENSIQRNTGSSIGYFDEIVSNKYFLSENMDYIFYAMKKYLNFVVKYFLCGYILKISFTELFKNATGWKFKLWFVLTLPASIAALLYFKIINGKFWRD